MGGQRRFGAVRLRGWYWHLPQPAINMEDFDVRQQSTSLRTTNPDLRLSF
jgi:hypothetical protein